MERETRITAPEGCEIEKVELVDCVAVVTFKEKERKLPKSWEEFCSMNRETQTGESCIMTDRANAETVLALCQLILLRDCYNCDWVTDYRTSDTKFTIEFEKNRIVKNTTKGWPCILIFKTEELRDEFLENFGDLIEKLKPLYGIKEGGEQ